jgi:hypothetical protein
VAVEVLTPVVDGAAPAVVDDGDDEGEVLQEASPRAASTITTGTTARRVCIRRSAFMDEVRGPSAQDVE